MKPLRGLGGWGAPVSPGSRYAATWGCEMAAPSVRWTDLRCPDIDRLLLDCKNSYAAAWAEGHCAVGGRMHGTRRGVRLHGVRGAPTTRFNRRRPKRLDFTTDATRRSVAIACSAIRATPSAANSSRGPASQRLVQAPSSRHIPPCGQQRPYRSFPRPSPL